MLLLPGLSRGNKNNFVKVKTVRHLRGSYEVAQVDGIECPAHDSDAHRPKPAVTGALAVYVDHQRDNQEQQKNTKTYSPKNKGRQMPALGFGRSHTGDKMLHG
jgi:hypothetical protein